MSAWNAMQGKQFFHASSHDYAIGTVLNLREEHHLHHETSDPGTASFTDDPESAKRFDRNLYSVQPLGRKHKDRDFPTGIQIGGKSFKTFAPVRIVGRVDQ